MKKFWNFIQNEDTSETELLFNGPISEDTWWGDEVTPTLFRDELAKVSGNLTVWLNSPGGDVFAASQIYSMLKNHKGKVTVKIDGIAASAASVVAMAGDETLIAPTALMMIHDPSTCATIYSFSNMFFLCFFIINYFSFFLKASKSDWISRAFSFSLL